LTGKKFRKEIERQGMGKVSPGAASTANGREGKESGPRNLERGKEWHEKEKDFKKPRPRRQ